MQAGTYQLPSNPSLLSKDPLGFCEGDSPTFWDIISVSLDKLKGATSLLELPVLIENLVYSLHEDGKLDLDFLKDWIVEFELSVGKQRALSVLNNIAESALSLPTLFPTHEILHLGPGASSLQLSLSQVRALVAHQILCTLTPPSGNNWGCTLRCWYSRPQPMAFAVRGYLDTTFRFFWELTQSPTVTIYQYFSSPSAPLDISLSQWRDCHAPLFERLDIEPTTSTTIPFPHPTVHCMLVSSHKEPGFGSSCTQEELITAACPQLLTLGALLIQPPVPDNAVLVARNVYPNSSWIGQGRNARLQHFLDYSTPYTFMFLDALELDAVETTAPGIPDLIPDNLIRELEKAYRGFKALLQLGIDRIATPIWGSGAFGGNPIVKSILLSMAAARAGVFVTLMIDEERRELSEHKDVRVLDALAQMKMFCPSSRVCDGLVALLSITPNSDHSLSDEVTIRLGYNCGTPNV